LNGEVKVRVQAADDPSNAAVITLFFVEREVPSPHHRHIDRKLLRQRRTELGLIQKTVGDQLAKPAAFIDKSAAFVAKIESGQCHPPDDVFRKLARIYGQPLAAFLKKPS
jgi:hypothetical protein